MKVRLHVSLTSYAGSDAWDEIEIPDEEWNAMDEANRESTLTEMLGDHVSNYLDSWWEEVPNE